MEWLEIAAFSREIAALEPFSIAAAADQAVGGAEFAAHADRAAARRARGDRETKP